MDFCFVHAADLHLDTPFDGIGNVAPGVAERLRNGSLEAFDRLIDFTIERDAQFLLLAGDIYDQSERGIRAQLRFRRGMEKLAAANIPVYAAFGNHDHLEGWSAISEWPANVNLFPAGAVQALKVRKAGKTLATVYGTSYGQRDVTQNLALQYHRDGDDGLHIGVLHCNLGGGDDGAYSGCTEDDLARAGLDYWALGHFHQHAVLRRDNPWIVYPGSLQGRSLKPTEQGEKGAVLVTVRAGRIAEVCLKPLDSVRFLPLAVHIAGLEDVAVLRERLQSEAETLYKTCAGRHLVIRGILAGRGTLHHDLERPDALSGLLTELRAEFQERDPFLFWEDLRDETRAEIDRAAIAQRNDFSAEVIKYTDDLLAQPEKLAEFVAEQFAALDKPRLRKSLEGLEADSGELLSEAGDLALELLEEGRLA